MKTLMSMLAGLLAAAVLVAGCGSSSGSAGGGGNTTVRTEHSSRLNANVLVNRDQMTLYTLSAEQKGRFICTAASTIPGSNASCVSVWVPLTVAKGATPSGPVPLGTVTRPDGGGTQVTYQGRPLYTFANDKAPGDASGNGFKDVGTWKAVTIGSSAPTTSASPGYGY